MQVVAARRPFAKSVRLQGTSHTRPVKLLTDTQIPPAGQWGRGVELRVLELDEQLRVQKFGSLATATTRSKVGVSHRSQLFDLNPRHIR